MKPVFHFLFLLLSVIYLIFVTVRYSRAEDTKACAALQIDILDSAQATFISKNAINRMLLEKNLHPIGQTMDKVSPLAIGRAVERDSFIRRAVCTITPGRRVRLTVRQRIPLLRVMADNGEDYYIDETGTRMKAQGYEADLPVVTGNVTPQFARTALKAMGIYLRGNDFWDDQVEQIVVKPNLEVDMTMRVGDHVVHFGRIEQIDQKFRNLHAFYTQILPEVGWYKYSEINVAYDGQVIGKRRKAPKKP